MFLCSDCHNRVFNRTLDNTFHSQSKGPCEGCGFTAVTGDCNCDSPRPQVKVKKTS